MGVLLSDGIILLLVAFLRFGVVFLNFFLVDALRRFIAHGYKNRFWREAPVLMPGISGALPGPPTRSAFRENGTRERALAERTRMGAAKSHAPPI